MLAKDEFALLVRTAPLFAMDLVVMNEHEQILVGERMNAPAKGFWFVPGGRVFKNETLDEAFARISHAELGRSFSRSSAICLGLYEHFYDDSFCDAHVSTHYINATHCLRLTETLLSELPHHQHRRFQWLTLDELCSDERVHGYSKIFSDRLLKEMIK